jgi:hypothetical protein
VPENETREDAHLKNSWDFWRITGYTEAYFVVPAKSGFRKLRLKFLKRFCEWEGIAAWF